MEALARAEPDAARTGKRQGEGREGEGGDPGNRVVEPAVLEESEPAIGLVGLGHPDGLPLHQRAHRAHALAMAFITCNDTNTMKKPTGTSRNDHGKGSNVTLPQVMVSLAHM